MRMLEQLEARIDDNTTTIQHLQSRMELQYPQPNWEEMWEIENEDESDDEDEI